MFDAHAQKNILIVMLQIFDNLIHYKNIVTLQWIKRLKLCMVTMATLPPAKELKIQVVSWQNEIRTLDVLKSPTWFFISWVEKIRIFNRAAHSWKFWHFQHTRFCYSPQKSKCPLYDAQKSDTQSQMPNLFKSYTIWCIWSHETLPCLGVVLRHAIKSIEPRNLLLFLNRLATIDNRNHYF